MRDGISPSLTFITNWKTHQHSCKSQAFPLPIAILQAKRHQSKQRFTRVIILSMTNRLVNESSPYLLQHTENPVDWYPWGAEALEKAQQEDRPIFLSIGYAACHWCHVMAHESFENASTAEVLNKYFVSIKVDREERPDIDGIYMDFVVSTTGSGGWPLSVFLTPEGKPFYGGTYFPSFRRHNLPAFREVLEAVAREWRDHRPEILASGDNLAGSLRTRAANIHSTESLSLEVLKQAIKTITYSYDWQNGGWGAAPKFPQPMLVELLLRQASRGDQASLDMALHALRAMAQGGMYDVLGGGFARYSMDATWLVPHFEKMLYDNAQLARVYLHAYQITKDPFLSEVCQASLDFILRELTHPLGGFYSSLDADSEGVEGKYYLWTLPEVRSVLTDPEDAGLFMAGYGVTEAGNFGGHTILRRVSTDAQLARDFQLEPSSLASRMAGLRHKLLEARNRRVRPATDDKVLVSWNALALAAFAEAGRALDREDYLEAAVHNASFLLENFQADGRLLRSWRDGPGSVPGFLEDYAGLGVALLSLYQADPDPRWYQAAQQMLAQVLAHFVDPAGGFFDTSNEHEALLYRPKELQDSATPSGSAQAVILLLKLAAYEGRPEWSKLAGDLLSANLGLLLRYPSAFAQWWCAADLLLGPAYEVAIVGDIPDEATRKLLQPLWHGYYPRLALAASSYPPAGGSPMVLGERPLINGKPTAYVCQDFVCRLPVNEPHDMLAQLQLVDPTVNLHRRIE